MQGQQHNTPRPDIANPFTPEILKDAVAAANKIGTAVEDFPRQMHNALCIDQTACAGCLIIGLVIGALGMLMFQKKS